MEVTVNDLEPADVLHRRNLLELDTDQSALLQPGHLPQRLALRQPGVRRGCDHQLHLSERAVLVERRDWKLRLDQRVSRSMRSAHAPVLASCTPPGQPAEAKPLVGLPLDRKCLIEYD